MNIQIIITVSIISLITSYIINPFITDFFYEAKKLEIPEQIYKNTTLNDDFAKYTNSQKSYIYCALDEYDKYAKSCRNAKQIADSKNFPIIRESYDVRKKRLKENPDNSLSSFIRKKCINFDDICIVKSRQKTLIIINPHSLKGIEKAINDYR